MPGRGSRVFTWAPAVAVVVVVAALTAVVLRPSDAGDRYLALGDSFAVGTGARSLDGYAPRLARVLRGRHGREIPTFMNLSMGGETTTSLLDGGQLDRALDAIGDDANRTRVVTVDIGANELLAKECLGGVAAAGCPFQANFTTIVRELRAALRDEPGTPELLVMGLYAPFPEAGAIASRSVRILLQGTDGRVRCRGRGLQIGMNDVIACVARRNGATFVDTFADFERDPKLVAPDGLHPSDSGHAAIAREFAKALG